LFDEEHEYYVGTKFFVSYLASLSIKILHDCMGKN